MNDPLRILFLCDGLPLPADQGDRIRCFRLISGLGRIHRLTVVCLSSFPVNQGALAELKRHCEDVVLVQRSRFESALGPMLHPLKPLTVARRWSPRLAAVVRGLVMSGKYDIAVAYQLKMVPYVTSLMPVLRVADLTDSLTLYLERARQRDPGRLRRAVLAWELWKVRRYERNVLGRLNLLAVASPVDKSALQRLGCEAPVSLVPNGVEAIPTEGEVSHPDVHGPAVVFVGNLAYPPNEDAVLWFVREVFPLVKRWVPEARFLIVGKNPSPRLQAIHAPGEVEVVGPVPDPRPWLAAASVVINPVRFGSGTRLKLLEAMGAGKAVVSTAIGAEGVDAKAGVHLEIADDAEAFARRVAEHLADPIRCREMGERARARVTERYRWDDVVDRFGEELGRAVIERRRGRQGSRVLYVITRGDWGGAQRHVVDLVQGLVARGGEAVVVSAPDGPLGYRVEAVGGRYIPLPELSRSLSPWRDALALARLARLFRRLSPDLVHVHSAKAGALGRLVAVMQRVPIIYTVHGYAFNNPELPTYQRVLYHSIERLLGRMAAAVIVVSRADENLALHHGLVKQGRLRRIPNGIPVPMVRPGRGRWRDPPVIGTVTRFAPEKGLEYLLEALSMVLKSRPARLLLIGDGPLRAGLLRRTRKMGIDSAVEFAGFRDDVAASLAAMDIYVLSSIKEGLPYSLLEAMAAGLPVVATAVGGVPDVVEDGFSGLLVRSGDPRAMATALLDLLDNPSKAKRLAAHASDIIQRNFTLESMYNNTFSLYQKVCNEKK